MRNICTIIVHFRQLLQIKRREICLGRSLESSFRCQVTDVFIFFCKFYRSEVFAGKRHFYGTLGQSPVPIPAVLLRYQKIYVCNNLNHIDQNATHKQSLQFFPVITINFIFINKITIFDIIELQYLTIFFQNTAERYKS